MKRLLDTAERWIRPIAIPHLAPILVGAQVVLYLWAGFLAPSDGQQLVERLSLVPSKVAAGEWWRPITFVALPPTVNPIFAAFAWLLFLFFSSGLERAWGTARFTLFLVVGWIATIAASLLAPDRPTMNGFIGVSVLLAFATLAPEFVLRLFFVLPVALKWIALVTWIVLGLEFVRGDAAERGAILACATSWLIFLGPDAFRRARRRDGVRRVAAAVSPARKRPAREPFHRCRVCGRTDRSDPKLEFRYCDRCAGAPCYCMDHLRDHEHLQDPAAAGASRS